MREASHQSTGLTPGPDSTVIGSALERALKHATPERREIIEQLNQRPWFRSTSIELQVELATLPAEGRENFDGFLKDLAERPDRISNVDVISLESLARAKFSITPIFNVRNDNGDNYTYEYVSWRHGPQSGSKGLVLIETEGKPTHFLITEGEKFATGQVETDSIGGFIDLNVDGVLSALDRIKVEIQEELGLAEINLVREPIELGSLTIDAGMTNNKPSIFVASIDASEARKLDLSPLNSDPYELAASIKIYPIAQLREVVMQNDDSFFLACVARGWANGDIPFL